MRSSLVVGQFLEAADKPGGHDVTKGNREGRRREGLRGDQKAHGCSERENPMEHKPNARRGVTLINTKNA